jgi:hypothetical protein
MNLKNMIQLTAASIVLFATVLSGMGDIRGAKTLHTKQEIANKLFQITEQVVLAKEIIKKIMGHPLDQVTNTIITDAERDIQEIEKQRDFVASQLSGIAEGNFQIDGLYASTEQISQEISDNITILLDTQGKLQAKSVATYDASEHATVGATEKSIGDLSLTKIGDILTIDEL